MGLGGVGVLGMRDASFSGRQFSSQTLSASGLLSPRGTKHVPPSPGLPRGDPATEIHPDPAGEKT